MPIKTFKNEPLTDFSKPAHRKAMEKALAKVRSTFSREYPIVIGGEEIWSEEKLKSYNPSAPSEIVGVFQKANTDIGKQSGRDGGGKI